MRLYDNQPDGTVARARVLRRAASPIERRLLRGLRDSHADTEVYDADRTATINAEGFRVIRFTNSDVASNLEGVLAMVAETLRSPSPPGAGAPGPLSHWERGRAAQPRRGEGDPAKKKGEAE